MEVIARPGEMERTGELSLDAAPFRETIEQWPTLADMEPERADNVAIEPLTVDEERQLAHEYDAVLARSITPEGVSVTALLTHAKRHRFELARVPGCASAYRKAASAARLGLASVSCIIKR